MSVQDTTYNPSFEKIITDKINKSCPTLNRSNDTGLSQNNIYIDQSVFNIVFKAFYNNLQLDPLEVKSSGSTSQLEYDHNKIIAQGDEINMYKLKEAMNELVKDQGLKNIIQYYKEMYDSLRSGGGRSTTADISPSLSPFFCPNEFALPHGSFGRNTSIVCFPSPLEKNHAP